MTSGKSLLASAMVVLVGGALWLVWPLLQPATPPPARSTEPARAASPALPDSPADSSRDPRVETEVLLRADRAEGPAAEDAAVPPQKAGISGVVRDALTGTPIEGAWLRWKEILGPTWSSAVRTDARGIFDLVGEFSEELLGEWELAVRAEGYSDRTLMPVGRNLTVALTPGIPCRGQVVDRETGAPLPGATVVAPGLLLSPDPAFPVSLDEEGRFTLFLAPGERTKLLFDCSGYCGLWVDVQVEEWIPAPATFPLEREAVLAGVVVDESGLPLQATVSVHHDHSREIPQSERRLLGLPGLAKVVLRSEEHAWFTGHRSCSSDSRGAFRVTGVPPSEEPCSVRARAPGYLQSTPEQVLLAHPGETTVRIVMTRAAQLTVTASQNGEPWTATLRWTGPNRNGALDRRSSSFTGPVEAGTVTLEAINSRGMVKHTWQVELEPGEERELVVSWTDSRSLLRGRVIHADGSGAAGVQVQATADIGSGHGRIVIAGGRTDSQGRFELSVLPASDYKVQAFADAAVATVENVTSDVEIELQLPPLGSRRLLLEDAMSGAPLNVAPFFFWTPGGEEHFRLMSSFTNLDRPSLRLAEHEFSLPLGTVDLRVVSTKQEFPALALEGLEVRETAGPTVVLRVPRGCSMTLSLRGTQDVETLRKHTLLMLREDQVPLVREVPGNTRSRFKVEADESFRREILNQRVDVNGAGDAVVPALAAGRYTLRSFPGDVEFSPAWFDVPDAAEHRQQIEWRQQQSAPPR